MMSTDAALLLIGCLALVTLLAQRVIAMRTMSARLAKAATILGGAVCLVSIRQKPQKGAGADNLYVPLLETKLEQILKQQFGFEEVVFVGEKNTNYVEFTLSYPREISRLAENRPCLCLLAELSTWEPAEEKAVHDLRLVLSNVRHGFLSEERCNSLSGEVATTPDLTKRLPVACRNLMAGALRTWFRPGKGAKSTGWSIT